MLEVYNARLPFESFNDEALRFARKYNLTMGAGSDAHVLEGVGTGALRMRRFETPGGVPHLAALGRDPPSAQVARVPAGQEVDGPGPRAARREGRGRVAPVTPPEPAGRNRRSGPRTTPGTPVPAAHNDISERYLQKAIAEMNDLGHEIAEAAGPERVPVLGSAIRWRTSSS